jgi:hypothetical protein
MKPKAVHAPNGTTWTVRRHWIPRLGTDTLWRRFRKKAKVSRDVASSVPDGCGADVGEGIVAAIAVVIILVVLVLIVLPLIVAIIDLVFVLLLAALGIVGRILFRRPWKIEATASDGARQFWHVVGLRASAKRRDEIASMLAIGITPPADPAR